MITNEQRLKLAGYSPEQIKEIKTQSKTSSKTGKINWIQPAMGLGGFAIGGLTGPVGAIGGAAAGTAAGGAVQSEVNKLLGKEDREPMEKLKDVGKETAKAAGEAAAWTLGGKLLRPIKTLSELRGYAVGKITQKIPGEVAVKAVKDYAKEATVTGMKKAKTFIQPAIEKFAGKEFTGTEILSEALKAADKAYKAGKVGRTVTAGVEKAVNTALKDQLHTLSPAVKTIDSLLTKTYGVKNAASGLLKKFLPYVIFGKLMGR